MPDGYYCNWLLRCREAECSAPTSHSFLILFWVWWHPGRNVKLAIYLISDIGQFQSIMHAELRVGRSRKIKPKSKENQWLLISMDLVFILQILNYVADYHVYWVYSGLNIAIGSLWKFYGLGLVHKLYFAINSNFLRNSIFIIKNKTSACKICRIMEIEWT